MGHDALLQVPTSLEWFGALTSIVCFMIVHM